MSVYDDAVAALNPFAHYHDQGASSTQWKDAEGGGAAEGNNGASLDGDGENNPSPTDTTPYSVTDGVDDYWSAPELEGSGYGNNLAGGVSWKFWFRTTESDTIRSLFGAYNDLNRLAIDIRINHEQGAHNPGHISFFMRDEPAAGGGNRFIMVADIGAEVYDGNWHLLVITATPLSHSQSKMYWDGQEVSVSFPLTDNLNASNLTTPFNYTPALAAVNVRGTVARHFPGDLWKPATWLRVLTAGEVTSIYDAGLAEPPPPAEHVGGRPLSAGAKASIFAQETGVVWLVLLTIAHPDLAETLRFVNNTEDIVSRGNTYTAFPFQIALPSERDGQPPIAQLAVDNVDRQVVQALRGLTTAPTITVELVTSLDWDAVEVGPYDFALQEARYNHLVVEGELSYENVLDEPYPAGRFTPSQWPGLF